MLSIGELPIGNGKHNPFNPKQLKRAAKEPSGPIVTVKEFHALQEKVKQQTQEIEQLKADRETLECTICNENLISVFLGCRHTFCKECTTNLMLNDSPCPLCRQSIHTFTLFARSDENVNHTNANDDDDEFWVLDPDDVKMRGKPDESPYVGIKEEKTKFQCKKCHNVFADSSERRNDHFKTCRGSFNHGG